MKYPELRKDEEVMQMGPEGYAGVCRYRQEEGERFPMSL